MRTIDTRLLLMAAFDFTEDDLKANQSGIISEKQKNTLNLEKNVEDRVGIVLSIVLSAIASISAIVVPYTYPGSLCVSSFFGAFAILFLHEIVRRKRKFAEILRQPIKEICGEVSDPHSFLPLAQFFSFMISEQEVGTPTKGGLVLLQIMEFAEATDSTFSCCVYYLDNRIMSIIPLSSSEHIVIKSMSTTQITHELQAAFNFTQDDLISNEAGVLTSQQARQFIGVRLRREKVNQICGMLLINLEAHISREVVRTAWIADQKLPISSEQFAALVNGLNYCVYYLNKSKRIISIKLLD